MKTKGRRVSKNLKVTKESISQKQTRSQLDRAFQESYDTEARTEHNNIMGNLSPFGIMKKRERLMKPASKAGASKMKIDKTQVTPGKWETKSVYSMTPKTKRPK